MYTPCITESSSIALKHRGIFRINRDQRIVSELTMSIVSASMTDKPHPFPSSDGLKILVIEDDAKTAALMQKGFAAEGMAIDVCSDGVHGLDEAKSHRHDVIVLDIALPDIEGWDVLTELRNAGLTTPVLVVTAKDAVEHRVKGLSLGADDYITKPFAFSELMARIRTVLRRTRTQPVGELKYDDLTIDQRRQKVMRGGTPVELSSKEFQLLQLLLEHKGEVLTRNFIAERVWDMKYEGESNVVDVNIRRLRAKIDDPFPQKLVHTVRGRGYVLR